MRGLSPGICAAIFAALPLAVSLRAYREGPLPAMTGGFGEPSCQSCHFGKPLNDPAGSLTVAGVPAQYEPGRVYSITVAIKRPNLRVAGFEMTARFSDGSRASEQAGSWRGPDALTRIVYAPNRTVEYMQHTKAGSQVTGSAGAWTVQWTAPKASDAIAIHVAANASNDDDSPLGDFIYTTMVKTRGR